MSSVTVHEPSTSDPSARRSNPVPGGALAAVAGALVLVVCNLLSGFYPNTQDSRELLTWFGANAGHTELVAATGLLASALLVPGIWAVTAQLRVRAPRLAGIGGWLMATGYVMGTVLSIEALSTLALLSAGADAGVLADAGDNHTPLTLTVLYFTFGLGALIGTIVLGVAMLRQHGTVPRWAGWALILSAPVRMAGLFTGLTLVGPPVASLLIAVGFVGVVLASGGNRRETEASR